MYYTAYSIKELSAFRGSALGYASAKECEAAIEELERKDTLVYPFPKTVRYQLYELMDMPGMPTTYNDLSMNQKILMETAVQQLLGNNPPYRLDIIDLYARVRQNNNEVIPPEFTPGIVWSRLRGFRSEGISFTTPLFEGSEDIVRKALCKLSKLKGDELYISFQILANEDDLGLKSEIVLALAKYKLKELAADLKLNFLENNHHDRIVYALSSRDIPKRAVNFQSLRKAVSDAGIPDWLVPAIIYQDIAAELHIELTE